MTRPDTGSDDPARRAGDLESSIYYLKAVARVLTAVIALLTVTLVLRTLR